MTGSNGTNTPVVPFSHLRLRGITGRLESGFDPKALVANSMGLALALPPVRHSTSPPLGSSSSPVRSRGPTDSSSASPRPDSLTASNTQRSLQSPKDARLGQSVPPCEQQQQLWAVAGAGAAAQPPQGSLPQTADITSALAEINALRSQIVGVETVMSFLGAQGDGSALTTMGKKASRPLTQPQLKQRSDRLTQSHNGPLSAGLRPRSAASSTESDSRSNVSDSGFNSLVGPQDFTKVGRTWRQNTNVVPVGRGEAVILSAALDETMPPGALAGKYTLQQRMSGADFVAGAASDFLSHQDMRKDFQAIDMVQSEAARQVSASCVERGQLLEKIRQRYEELFAALSTFSSHLVDVNANLAQRLAASEASAEEHKHTVVTLRDDLDGKQTEVETLRYTVASQVADFDASQWDLQQRVEQLQGQNDILAGHVEQYQADIEEAAADKERALEEGLSSLEDKLALVADERDDLLQRIRFLERQVVRMRQDANFLIPTSTVEVQTDPVEFGLPQEASDNHSDADDVDQAAADQLQQRLNNILNGEGAKLTTSQGTKKQRLRFLGHFQGLIQTHRVGRVRGVLWTHTCISTIYTDKLISDTVADREGNARTELHDFTFDWHITRFGLRNLAELNLLDLIASVRQHYKSSARINWFAQFVGLVESNPKVDTLPHVSFYIFSLQQLSYPNALSVLFPETEELPVMLRQPIVLDAIRAIFRYLNDPDAALSFLARSVDPITDESTDPPTILCEELVNLLMAEFQKRIDRNIAHLRALFRAGDLDGDNAITYDEFCALVRHAAPDIKERAVTRMYTEAVRSLPDGATMVDCDTFVATCRCYNFDRWKIELPSAATMAVSRPVSAVSTFRDVYSSGLASVQSNKTLMKQIESAVESLDPPLEEQLRAVREKCTQDGRTEMLVLIDAQAARFHTVYQSQDDAHTAWLMFRILVSTIASAMLYTAPARVSVIRPSRSRRTSTRVVPDSPWKSGASRSRPVTANTGTLPHSDSMPPQFFGLIDEGPLVYAKSQKRSGSLVAKSVSMRDVPL